MSTLREEGLVVLRTQWEFAGLLNFLKTFRTQVGLKPYTAEELENGFLDPQDNVPYLELHIQLMRGLTDRPSSVTMMTVYQHIASLMNSLLDTTFDEEVAPLLKVINEHDDYDTIPLLERVRIAYFLCNMWVTQHEDVLSLIKKAKAESNIRKYRTLSLGHDVDGFEYYYLSDLKLYRDLPVKTPAVLPPRLLTERRRNALAPRRENNPFIPAATSLSDYAPRQWELVCDAIASDWRAFIDRLADTNSRLNKQLAQKLDEEVLPSVMGKLEAKERARKRQEKFEFLPRKRSSRLQVRDLIRQEEERLEQERLKKEEQMRLVREAERQQREEKEREMARARRAEERAERARQQQEEIEAKKVARAIRIAEREERLRKQREEEEMRRLEEEAEAERLRLQRIVEREERAFRALTQEVVDEAFEEIADRTADAFLEDMITETSVRFLCQLERKVEPAQQQESPRPSRVASVSNSPTSSPNRACCTGPRQVQNTAFPRFHLQMLQDPSTALCDPVVRVDSSKGTPSALHPAAVRVSTISGPPSTIPISPQAHRDRRIQVKVALTNPSLPVNGAPAESTGTPQPPPTILTP